MNNFKKPYSGRRSSGRPESGRKSRTGGVRRPESVQLFDAVCSSCGNKCQVPFRPNGTRPVYCKNCFGAPRDTMSPRKRSSSLRPTAASGTETGGKSIADLTRQIAAMNAKIDTMLKILEDGGSEE